MSLVQLPVRHELDRAHNVIELMPSYIELAGRIANTEFVPTNLRRRPEAVLAALMAGAERGLGPMESLRSINVIEGKPNLSAEAMRALVLAAGHEIDIVESTATKATVVGRRAGADSTSPPFTWTIERARRARLAGKDNWVKYPEAMLLARASTDLCRAVFPDVIAGLASTEEVVDELAPEPATTRRRAPARAAMPAAAPVGVLDTVNDHAARGTVAHSVPGEAGSTPATAAPIDVDEIPGSDQPSWGTPPPSDAPDPQLAKRIHAEVAKAFPKTKASDRDRWRHALVALVSRDRNGGPITSSSDLEVEEQLALSKVLTQITAGNVTVADAPDDHIEIRSRRQTATVTLDPPTVDMRDIEPTEEPQP